MYSCPELVRVEFLSASFKIDNNNYEVLDLFNLTKYVYVRVIQLREFSITSRVPLEDIELKGVEKRLFEELKDLENRQKSIERVNRIRKRVLKWLKRISPEISRKKC